MKVLKEGTEIFLRHYSGIGCEICGPRWNEDIVAIKRLNRNRKDIKKTNFKESKIRELKQELRIVVFHHEDNFFQLFKGL